MGIQDYKQFHATKVTKKFIYTRYSSIQILTFNLWNVSALVLNRPFFERLYSFEKYYTLSSKNMS